jgi:hypothetical protein
MDRPAGPRPHFRLQRRSPYGEECTGAVGRRFGSKDRNHRRAPEDSMFLYLIHCGFYDELTSFGGVFESHINLFLVAESAEAARQKAKASELFKSKRMHIDGIQQVEMVDGYRVLLSKEPSQDGETRVHSFQFRDLAPDRRTT